MRELRRLGSTDLETTPVALGCWPMAGVTTLDANHADGVATVHAAIDAGINQLDTAYVYGPKAESDLILHDVLADRREEVLLASKGGIHYGPGESGKLEMLQDGRPETIMRECDESLARLGVEQIDLFYLHSPDPKVPVTESASGFTELLNSGKIKSVGVSNCTLEQIEAFAAVCPLSAVQLPYNMLQRDIEQQTLPWCIKNQVSVMVYWPLMKGLLAGKIPRDHQFEKDDSRANYPMYQGKEWERNQDFVDKLRELANDSDRTVSELVVRWTLEQPGITAVLCGAKRAWQIEESAKAQNAPLSPFEIETLSEAIRVRGKAESKRLFT